MEFWFCCMECFKFFEQRYSQRGNLSGGDKTVGVTESTPQSLVVSFSFSSELPGVIFENTLRVNEREALKTLKDFLKVGPPKANKFSHLCCIKRELRMVHTSSRLQRIRVNAGKLVASDEDGFSESLEDSAYSFLLSPHHISNIRKAFEFEDRVMTYDQLQ